MRIYTLRANSGDCFLIDFDNQSCILIDGGFGSTYNDHLKDLLLALKAEGKFLEFVISTHYDMDHIKGLLSFFSANGQFNYEKIIPVHQVITNGIKAFSCERMKQFINDDGLSNETTQISAEQQVSLENLCQKNNYPINLCNNGDYVKSGDTIFGNGYSIKFLTPNEERLDILKRKLKGELLKQSHNGMIDNIFLQHISSSYYEDVQDWKKFVDRGSALDEINSASLSFELECNGKYLLFCGDSEMMNAKKHLRCHYDVIKLSHHGTYYGNKCFIGENAVIADNYIISTNANHPRREHPNRRLLAEIITLPHYKKLYFNYDITLVKNEMYYLLKDEEQKKKYKFESFLDYRYLEI